MLRSARLVPTRVSFGVREGVLFNDFHSCVSADRMAVVDTNFPLWALLPKKETGVTSFLSKYPEYDGRGITIAILDSGVDPAAPGLQVTSDGKRKVVEIYDCSGAGDVDISTVVQAKDGEIIGITGRKLKIPSDWHNPSGNYHIGVKNAYELYTANVRERVDKERREKRWDPAHKIAIADVNRKIQEFEKEHPVKANLRGLDKLKREDLDSQLEALLESEKKYSGLGPTYDCVVFYDGEVWRACVDTSECGDLASCKLIGEYSKTYDCVQLTSSDQLNYGVNVWDDGKVLEVVVVCISHGTHVAAIAAANFPDEPEKNGVAPGAQIISLGIGDLRLTSMETGTAISRAIIRIMQNKNRKIHVMNMSYGEHPHYQSGRIIDMANELVDKYGPVWVCSAGNHGPALSTVSTPPDLGTTNLISVGAYVSPDMMIAQYSLRQKQPGVSCTWTSRGPTATGDTGVTVCAPGAAITSVPQCMLRNCQLMNGTSMASPHVCGVVSLLLSGMEQRGLPYSPHSVKRALENTAAFIESEDEFGQGHGLVQVGKAFEHLVSYCNQPERNIRFHLRCGNQSMRGIYLRDKFHDKPEDTVVSVEPVFQDSSNIDLHSDKINLMMSLSLVCDKPWVSHPAHLCLMNMDRSFTVRIDPVGLAPGVHTASIKAYDTSCVEKGPVFRIPITVIQPHVIPADQPKKELTFNNVTFKPYSINRHYVIVPEDATWAVIHMNGAEKTNVKIHALHLRPRKACKTHEFMKLVTLTPNVQSINSFAVRGGVILELVVAKFWTDACNPTINYTLSFYGIKPDRDQVVMQASDGIFRMDLRCGIQPEEVAPSVSLKNAVAVCKPSDAKIIPLSPSRDLIPPGRQIYELQLTYTFHLNRANEVSPMCPVLSHVLYESEFESQLWMLFNSNKQFITTGDAYADQHSVKLEKGDYTIRMHIRHERQDLLEKLTEKPMLISQKLPSVLSLDIFQTEGAAITGGRKLVSYTLPAGHVLPIYIAPLNNDKITKAAQLGQYLTGTITFAKDELGKKVCTYPFRYIMTDPKKGGHSNATTKTATSNDSNSKDSNNSNNVNATNNGSSNSNGESNSGMATNCTPSKEKESKEKPKMKYEEFLDSLVELKTSSLAKLERGDQADALYEELKAAHADNLSVHTSMLANLKSAIIKQQYPIIADQARAEYGHAEDTPTLDKILAVANAIIEQIDQNALLAYYGMKADVQQDAVKVKTQMDRQKSAVIEALSVKGIVLCRRFLATGSADQNDKKESKDKSSDAVSLENIDAVWSDILKFVEQKDAAIQCFLTWHAAAHGHYGRVLKVLNSINSDKPTRDVEHGTVCALRALGWEHWAKHIEDSTHVRYPHSYRLF